MQWSDVTFSQYKRYYELMNKKDKMNEIDFAIAMVSIFYCISEAQVEDLPINDFNERVHSLSFLASPIPEQRMAVYVDIDNKKYHITQLMKDLTIGQFIDLQIALSSEVNEVEKMGEVFKCFLCDAENKRYIPNVDIGNARVVDVYSVMLFFYKFRKHLLRVTRKYLDKSEKKLKQMQRETLQC